MIRQEKSPKEEIKEAVDRAIDTVMEELEEQVSVKSEEFKTGLFKRLRQEPSSSSFWNVLRSTEEYRDVCVQCRDEILIYPSISGRTKYSQEEVEDLALEKIIAERIKDAKRI